MEQAIFLLVVLVITFLNWGIREGGFKKLTGRGADEEESQAPREPHTPPFGAPGRPTPPPVRRSSTAGDEGDAELRKFMEALGLPSDAAPPAPVPAPAPAPPPPPRRPPQLPTPVRTPSRPVATPSAPARVRRPRVVQAPVASATLAPPPLLTVAESAALPAEAFPSAPAMRMSASDQESAHADAYRIDRTRRRTGGSRQLAALLGSRESLRSAILLREVLGEPVGLRDL